MKGSRIIVTNNPRGVFEEVIIKTGRTPKPGTCMEIVPSIDPVEGVFTYAEYGIQAASSGQYVAADGDKKCIAILVEKDQEAGIYSAAYAAGDRAKVYYPAMGEQFNMLVEDVSGTGDDKIVGEEYMLDNGTGKLLTADDNAEAHPFTGLEASTNPLADELIWCRFNGEGGA